ncbi:hypothetical protein P4V86_16950 [Brevibacillus laterosporus]|uniref:hypothetical protein n=1 Tax=Brevibacillus laterosporus TaxID=1465 RepID=UPI000366911F|nr:hypothetical protein [Brevibacillus laterosporus]ATO49842.1 hypothetical protein BrL25_12555 [Brevibacillus laterosporus DSM 25]MBG9801580.1 hypothetical protein [Brevibacillus laterosporus]MDF9412476.1 hypothetical protein [Brevibacillus laterosporus]MED1789212.1 hypothetical protein [Brevibacillus laterosporus]MED2005033.1 hypothetical protein [Brevibacillus laterosporus]
MNTVKVIRDGKWTEVETYEIIKGEKFRMIEPSGKIFSEMLATSAPMLKDGTWVIDAQLIKFF